MTHTALPTHQQIAEDFADLIIASTEARDRGGLLGEAEKSLSFLRATGDLRQLEALLALRADRNQPYAQTRNMPLYYQLLYGMLRALLRTYPDLTTAEVTLVLSWAVRLARYRSQTDAGPLGAGVLRLTPDDERLPPRIQRREKPAPVKPTGPELPGVGVVFAGKILELDDNSAVLEVPGFGREKAVALLADLGGKRFRVGNAARVEVTRVRTLKSGLQVLDVKVAPPSVPATS